MTFDDDIYDDEAAEQHRLATLRFAAWVDHGLVGIDPRLPLADDGDCDASPPADDVSAVLHFTEDLPFIENRAGY